MSASFFFYDLETSGLNTKTARIMQFAGQRTDMDLQPIGEPVNELIKLAPDVLPEPQAILVTGITPQQVNADGLTEAEFLQLFYEQVATTGTIFVGYNSVRFDDEFMRYLMWRNFYDPYEWQWKNDRSRWDLLDVVRLTRALRPDGIEWPDDARGQASNRLELLTAANKLEHSNAHDALADVNATIALAKLIKTTQAKLFDYMLDVRGKASVEKLVVSGQPFVYASGKYPSEYQKTTVVIKLADAQGGALVYDLRHDVSEFASLSASELAKRMEYTKDEKAPARLPVKTLKFNRCPTVAPLGVLDSASQKRLVLDLKTIEANKQALASASGFASKVAEALALADAAQQKKWAREKTDSEAKLYDGFISDGDKSKLTLAREASDNPGFSDRRLAQIWSRYKARNYPKLLSSEERADWEDYCREKLTSSGESSLLANYFKQLAALKAAGLTSNQEFLLEELELYGQSIVPLDN